MTSQELNILAVYNADEKRLAAIFKHSRLAVFYIFGKGGKDMKSCQGRISNAIKYKRVMRKNDIGFNCAVRRATKQQLNTLGNLNYIILDDATKHRVTNDMLLQFNDTAESYTIGSNARKGRLSVGAQEGRNKHNQNMRDNKDNATKLKNIIT